MLYSVLIVFVPVWCLGQNVEFDCVGSWSLPFHPAGDVTRVFVVPGRVKVKTGMPRIGGGDAGIKIV